MACDAQLGDNEKNVKICISTRCSVGAKKPPTLQVFPLLSWDVGQSSPKEGNFQSKFMKMSGAVTHDPNHGKLKY